MFETEPATCKLQTAMLKNFITYYEQAVKAVENESNTWARVREHTSDLVYRLTQMKFLDPADGEEANKKELEQLHQDILRTFQTLAE